MYSICRIYKGAQVVKKLWLAASHNFIKVLLTPQLTKMGIFFKEVWGDFLTGIKEVACICYCLLYL